MRAEQKLAVAHTALKRIASSTPPDKLNRQAERYYGLTAQEAVSVAYEDIIEEAKRALKLIGRLPRLAKIEVEP